MENRYYNKEEFKYITSLIDINPFLARQKIEEYISNHGKDYYIISQYIYCLIILGNFDEAEIQLKEFEFIVNGSKYLNRNPNSINMLEEEMMREYHLRPEDKLDKLSNSIKLLSTFMDINS